MPKEGLMPAPGEPNNKPEPRHHSSMGREGWERLLHSFKERSDSFLEKHDRKIGMWLSHLDNLLVSPAAAHFAYAANPDPLFVTAVTRTTTRLWDFLVSPIIAEGFVYLAHKYRGEEYRIVPGFVKYEISHAAAHVLEEPITAGLTYAALSLGASPAEAGLIGEAASVVAIHTAANYLLYSLVEKAGGRLAKYARKLKYNHDHSHDHGHDHADHAHADASLLDAGAPASYSAVPVIAADGEPARKPESPTKTY